MESIKLGDLYLSKSELDDIAQLVAKKRHIEDYQNKSSNKVKCTVLVSTHNTAQSFGQFG